MNFGDCFDLFSLKRFEPISASRTGKSAAYMTGMSLTEDQGFVAVRCYAPVENESFIAAAPLVEKNGTIPQAAYIDWAKTMCLYINSLSNITGVDRKAVFYGERNRGSNNNYYLDTGLGTAFSCVSFFQD